MANVLAAVTTGLALLATLATGPNLVTATAPAICTTYSSSGKCLVYADDTGGTPANGPSTPGSGGSDSGPPVCTKWDGAVIDCVSPMGTWSKQQGCYIELADPQPALTDPVWAGRTEGVVYWCTFIDNSVATGMRIYVWFAEAQPGPAPRELAQQALAQMEFRAGQLGMSPGADALQIVGMQTWLWVADPDEHTVGPMTRTVTAGAVTVTATARLQEVHWDMGDGTAGVVCDGPGTAYDPALGTSSSPTCGYTYARSTAREDDQAYTVTATSRWVVHWEGGGESGDIPLSFDRSVEIQVGEIQALATSSR